MMSNVGAMLGRKEKKGFSEQMGVWTETRGWKKESPGTASKRDLG